MYFQLVNPNTYICLIIGLFRLWTLLFCQTCHRVRLVAATEASWMNYNRPSVICQSQQTHRLLFVCGLLSITESEEHSCHIYSIQSFHSTEAILTHTHTPANLKAQDQAVLFVRGKTGSAETNPSDHLRRSTPPGEKVTFPNVTGVIVPDGIIGEKTPPPPPPPPQSRWRQAGGGGNQTYAALHQEKLLQFSSLQ